MTARPVSYYALFKWWLLLSQHPGCHRNQTSFVTEWNSGTLAGDLGCFPLEREASPPRSDSRTEDAVFGVGFRRVPGKGPDRIPSLYPRIRQSPRLALKPFRRERAISRFDETLTPPHRSSPSFSTLVSSVLHAVLPALQPAHG